MDDPYPTSETDLAHAALTEMAQAVGRRIESSLSAKHGPNRYGFVLLLFDVETG